jgi:hypothetical protein
MTVGQALKKVLTSQAVGGNKKYLARAQIKIGRSGCMRLSVLILSSLVTGMTVSATASESVRRKQMNKPKLIPSCEDVMKVQ